jgi:pyruvate formate lyase activating enzyme
MEKIVTGVIFDIQKFSLHDGPGIRTTVFLKGCPLRCQWCHNPEGLNSLPEIVFSANKCIDCKSCYAVCKRHALTVGAQARCYDKTKCISCGNCVSICPGGAVYWVGRKMAVREVFDLLAVDIPYYQNSTGGVTISGGEPLAQFEFTFSLLSLCKEAGLGTVVETSLFQDYEKIEIISPLVDLFYCDLKLIDCHKHREYVGVSNKLILDNLKRLHLDGNEIVVHTPLVPGITDSEDNIQGIALWMKENIPGTMLELLNYNPLARAKWENLQLDYAPGDLKPFKIDALWGLVALAEKTGVKTLFRQG